MTRTRQQRAHKRGYNFENSLVNYFKDFGWHSKRLGGSSIHIPDIISTKRYNGKYDYYVTVEAKATGLDRVEIPNDEVWRCFNWFDMFPIYNDFPLRQKHVIFAYKFLSRKAGDFKKKDVKGRTPKEYYHILKLSEDPDNIMARSFISRIKNAYCNYTTGPKLVFKDNEGEQYVTAMERAHILKSVNSFKDVIDTILFDC